MPVRLQRRCRFGAGTWGLSAQRAATLPCAWPDLRGAGWAGGRVDGGLQRSGFDADAFYRWLSDFQPTWYTAVPTIHRALLAAADRHKSSIQRHSLRLIRSASAALPASELSELESLFGVPVIETYGMTEAASQIAANPLQRRKPGSVGQPAGAEIIIMDGEGRQLTADETGEIALRGPTITSGYDNDDAATEAAFRDGWFRTGDLGYLDRDGYSLSLAAARTLSNGEDSRSRPPRWKRLCSSTPSVIEAVAFSIPHARLGEDVAAAVVLRRGAKISVQNLRNFARERLADYKVPGLIRIVPEIAKRPSRQGPARRNRRRTFNDAAKVPIRTMATDSYLAVRT